MNKADGITPNIIFDDVIMCLGFAEAELEPGVRSGALGRAVFAWMLRECCGLSWWDIANEVGWASGRNAGYALVAVESSKFSGDRRLGGMTTLHYCKQRVKYLRMKHEPLMDSDVPYGHNPGY